MEKLQESKRKVAFKLPQIGSLWYENIFVSETHPILYTCIDKQNNHYICLFSVESAKLRKWLISPVETQTIIDMLEDKITIRECLAQRKNKNPNKYTVVQVGNRLNCLINEPVDWNYETLNGKKVSSIVEMLNVKVNIQHMRNVYGKNIMLN